MVGRRLDSGSDGAAASIGNSLLITKLRPPKLGSEIISRRRLRDRLRAGLAGPLTLVIGPAGYGKTTALVAVFADYAGPWGWLSLDEHDNDLSTFIEYLVGAIQTTYPEAGRATLSLLRQPRPPSPDLLARTLANELAALPQGFALAIDEFDVIRDPLIHALLDALLRHPTAALHLVIAAREQPVLALGRLRSRGLLTEIDTDLLRFTRGETQTFLERALRVAISAETVTGVDERVEGWPAGLRLIALAATGQHDPLGVADTLAGARLTAAQAFLWEEVLARQSAAAQTFLMQTARFDRFCSGLADAVLPPSSAENNRDLLERLVRANLFIIALDEDEHGAWYRYHSLFRDVLRQRLTDRMDVAGQAVLHARASSWFADHGLIEEALDHALLAEAIEAAVALIEAHAPEAFNREQWRRVERWLGRLPPEVLAARPALLIARAWILQLRARMDGIPALLAAAEARLDQAAPDDRQTQAIRGQIETLRGGARILAGDLQLGLADVRAGWKRMPGAFVYARRVAVAYWAIAAQALGQGEATRRALEAEEADFERALVYAEGLAFGVAYHFLAEGTLHVAEAIMVSLLQAAQTQGFGLSAAWAHFLLGRISYEWDDLPSAEIHYRAVIERRDQAHFLPLQGSLFGLALTLAARGDVASAERHLQSLSDVALQTWSPTHLAALRSLRARLALQQGDVATALRWSPPLESQPRFIPVFALEVPAMTRAQMLLALGDQTGVDAATADLDQTFAAWRDTPHLVQAVALQALAQHARNEPARALDLLERAVRLATPGGMMRTFLDLGSPLAPLIAELVGSGRGGEHATRLQWSFARAVATARTPPASVGALIEPLTPRETEVLKLLQQRLSDREIAEALHISSQTVHTHTRNLYQKLQVERRQDAVAEAARLGLLADR